ncbi:MAG: hypothetical protein O3A63_14420 [Proteobacteria bacterium]|nr:hypothetical protein [Pseudomonadota bacterium]
MSFFVLLVSLILSGCTNIKTIELSSTELQQQTRNVSAGKTALLAGGLSALVIVGVVLLLSTLAFMP